MMKEKMKENMIAVGSYLIAGLLSFALLVAATKYLNDEPSVPMTAAAQDAAAQSMNEGK